MILELTSSKSLIISEEMLKSAFRDDSENEYFNSFDVHHNMIEKMADEARKIWKEHDAIVNGQHAVNETTIEALKHKRKISILNNRLTKLKKNILRDYLYKSQTGLFKEQIRATNKEDRIILQNSYMKNFDEILDDIDEEVIWCNGIIESMKNMSNGFGYYVKLKTIID